MSAPGILAPAPQQSGRFASFGPSVLRLLKDCRPSAVAWRVWAVVVDAIERSPSWARSHVCKKCGEIVSPTVAHSDASSAVVGVVLIGLGIAPMFGGYPRQVFGRAAAAVFCESALNVLHFRATATGRLAAAEIGSHYGEGYAAIAMTQPHDVTRWKGAGALLNHESTEALAGQVMNDSHSLFYRVGVL